MLRALGVDEEMAHTSMRFGLGRFTTEEEVDYVIDLVVDKVNKLRELSPLYEMAQGRHRYEVHSSGRRTEVASFERRKKSWRTAKRSSTTTRTRAMSGRSTRTTDDVGTGLVGAPACGDVMKLQLKISDDGRHRGRQVQDLRLRLGDRLALAGDRMGEGQDASTRRWTIKNTEIVQELALPPVKIHCSVLAEDAIKAAIADYKAKRAAKREAQAETAKAAV